MLQILRIVFSLCSHDAVLGSVYLAIFNLSIYRPTHLCVSVCVSRIFFCRHVSFVDCPGHDILMATMLNGAAVMDAALLLIAGNEPCPQPQTSEHLAAVEIMRLQHIIILQVRKNKKKKTGTLVFFFSLLSLQRTSSVLSD